MPTWTNASGGNWTGSANWTGGVPNSVGAVAVFDNLSTAPGPNFYVVNLGSSPRTVGSLTLSASPNATYELHNGTLNMQSNTNLQSNGLFLAEIIVNVQGTGNNLPMRLGSTATLQLSSNVNVDVATGGILGIAAITGAGSLFKDGGGLLQLFGANTTRTGATSVLEGTLQTDAVNALGSGALTVNGSTARLELNGFSQSTGALLASTAGVINSTTAATLTLNQTQFGSYGGTITGAIELVKNGSSFLYLTAQNTYTGFTTVAAGTLNLVHENAISASGRVFVNAGAFLTVESPNAGTTANVNLRGLEGAGNVSITGAGNATVTITGDGGLFSGTMSNARLGLIINSGFTSLSGNGNTYAGGTTINDGGTLRLGAAGTTGSVGTGTVTINAGGNFQLNRSDSFTFANAMTGTGDFFKNLGGTVTLSGNNSGFSGILTVFAGTLRSTDVNSLGNGAALHVTAASTLDLAGSAPLTTYNFRSLHGSGIIQSLSTNFNSIAVNQSSNSVFSGNLDGATLSLVKLNTGTLTLSGVNTMGGTVYVGFGSTAGGTLALTGSGSLSQATFINIAANSTFDISGISATSTSIRDLEGAGGSVVLGGKTLEVTAQSSSQQNLTFIGSAGADAVNITLANSLNTFDLSRYTLSNWTDYVDRLTLAGNANANTLSGTAFADTILGDGGNDIIDGRGGNDRLNGDSGNDTIDGGAGNDELYGGENDDTLRGGADQDTLFGNAGNDILDGGTGSDFLNGGLGDDIIYYDAADAFGGVYGGQNTDTLIVVGGTAPTHLNLVAQQFEIARHVVSDTGNAFTWAVVTETYNASWQRTSTDQVNDDNTRVITDFDPGGQETWNNVTTTSNAAGERIRQNIVNDDNSYRYFFWDRANVETWATFDEEYTAAGARSVQRIQNDNGTSRTFYWDATNVQTWSTFDEEYAVGGARTIQRVIYDDGTNVTQTFDHNNTQTWSTITDYYNAAGQRTEQRIINDNNSYVRVFYDPTNVQPWSTQTDTYNTAGVLESSVQVPD